MRRHVLKARETPEALSAYYGIPVCMLLRVNQGVEWRAGARLLIPPPDYCARKRREVETVLAEYRVQPGDTVYSVADRFSTSMRLLMRQNGFRHPDEMRPGSTIQVPCLSKAFYLYTVRTLDTLEGICAAQKVTREEIEAYNPPVAHVYPGAQLVLPRRPE